MPKKAKSKKKSADEDWNDPDEDLQLEKEMKGLSTEDAEDEEAATGKKGKKKVAAYMM